MEERDQLALGANSGLFVDETNASRSTAVESASEIVHDEAHMVNARTPFGDELADG